MIRQREAISRFLRGPFNSRIATCTSDVAIKIEKAPTSFIDHADSLLLPDKVYSMAEEKFIEHEKNRDHKMSPPDAVDWDRAMEVIKNIESHFPEPKVDKEELKKNIAVLNPTYNFAKIIKESSTLQSLVDLGVNLSKWEENPRDAALAMSLDFAKDVAPTIRFLADLGVDTNVVGSVLTINPGLFRQDLDDLKVRAEYLKWKRFTPLSVATIVTRCPDWLNVPVIEIDSKLGYFQRGFGLTGNQIRKMVLSDGGAHLVVWSGVHMQVERNKYVITDDMNLGQHGARSILLKCPKVYMTDDEDVLRETFELIKSMYTDKVMLSCPEILSCPILTLRPRHKFLQLVKRDQYDPSKPNYVSPKRFMIDSDEDFCHKVAKVPSELYNKFLLTV